MNRIPFSLKFVKEVLLVLREKPLKEIVFGKRIRSTNEEKDLLRWISNNPVAFKAQGGRRGEFLNLDLVHKGKGRVYLLPNRLGDEKSHSILLLDDEVTITPGPDLYVYLSTEADARKGFGEYLNHGPLKGSKGGQSYVIEKPIEELSYYKSVVIYCNRFETLFTFAPLAVE